MNVIYTREKSLISDYVNDSREYGELMFMLCLNSHRRRLRDETVEFYVVGVGGAN